MATKKETISLNILPEEALKMYVELDKQIKELTAQKEQMAAIIKQAVKQVPDYNPAVRYDHGPIITSHRSETVLDQLKCFEAMSKPAIRKELFPTAIEFKAGKDKALLAKYGLLNTTYSDLPIIEIAK